MFDRFVRGAQARQALREGRFEEALDLSRDPLLRDERRAEALRDRAVDGLFRRAEKRVSEGAHAAALADLDRIRSVRPDDARVGRLRERIDGELTARQERGAHAMGALREARDRLEAGDLAAARSSLATARELGASAHELEAVQTLMEARDRRATDQLAHAREALQRGEHDIALSGLRAARALDHDLVGAEELGRGLASAMAATHAAELRRIGARGGLPAAAQALRDRCEGLPELAVEVAVRDEMRQLRHAQATAVRQRLEAGDAAGALRLLAPLSSGDPAASSSVFPEEVWADRVRQAWADEQRGAFEAAAVAWVEIGDALGIPVLHERAVTLRSADGGVERALAEARDKAAAGQLLEARQLLLPVLVEHPEHATVRAELDRLRAGEEARRERLAEVRAMIGEHRLHAARAAALGLSVTGPEGDEVRALVAELDGRVSTVRRGLDQVLRDLHGRDSAGRDGLCHCARRLEQLAAEQTDDAELNRVRVAVDAELRGIELLEAAGTALAAGRIDEFRQRVQGLEALRADLLDGERLAARASELADALLERTERSLRGGLAGKAGRLAAAGEPLAAFAPSVADRISDCRERVAVAARRAGERAADGQRALHVRDVGAARQELAAARELGCDVPAVLALEQALQGVRRDEHLLDEVEALARGDDAAAAARHLNSMGTTPPQLRTRVFDLRRDLARAQGLGKVFLLRVDEAGEFVVVRSDSWTIGNLRDGSADLRILARLAGVHARFVRTMSFHGGQVDKVVAERGPVDIDGSSCEEAGLVDGQVLALGDALSLRYERPSQRSLTANLRLLGGFQVAGTERLLWFKDRGRDGRILLGPGQDAHVRLPGAAGEVELFSDRDGGLRVRVPSEGRIDGERFHGEHAILPGAWVDAAGVSFTVLPWRD